MHYRKQRNVGVFVKGTIFWIALLVISGLILQFIVYPESLTTVKDNIVSLFPKQNPQISDAEIVRLVPSEMEEYGYFATDYKSCAKAEALGEASGIRNIKEKACRESCGLRDMEYFDDACEKDLFVCYCVA